MKKIILFSIILFLMFFNYSHAVSCDSDCRGRWSFWGGEDFWNDAKEQLENSGNAINEGVDDLWNDAREGAESLLEDSQYATCEVKRRLVCETGLEHSCDAFKYDLHRVQGTSAIQIIHDEFSIPQDIHQCYDFIDNGATALNGIETANTTVEKAIEFFSVDSVAGNSSILEDISGGLTTFATGYIGKALAKEIARCSCKAVSWKERSEVDNAEMGNAAPDEGSNKEPTWLPAVLDALNN